MLQMSIHTVSMYYDVVAGETFKCLRNKAFEQIKPNLK
jgi:hypothetical protein